MPDSPSRPSIARAVLIAALLTLLVTALRLLGEQRGWSPTIWNREPGGGGSPLGISWLVLPFGFWFGRLLAKNGHRPAAPGKALLFPILAMVAVVVAVALIAKTGVDWTTRAYLVSAIGLAAGFSVFAAWRRAWFVLACYGVLARIPVILVQYESIRRGWDNHYAKLPPDANPDDALFVLTMAQSVVWPFGWTVIVGGIAAALGAATVRRR
jgi:hypothetical protein